MEALFGYKSLLVIHAAATWAMLGAILIVQIVHYPLFAQVGSAGFPEYEAMHTSRITWVVAPLMLAELATAVGLIATRPSGFQPKLLWIGLILLAIIWASTAFVQVPLHNKLMNGFDQAAHAKLVATNWIRTGAWAARGAIAIALLLRYTEPAGRHL